MGELLNGNFDEDYDSISQISVGGYKSISREQSIEIRPLTVLAGANSSGKSSIMQPLLLLKQTLEANYDPGALLLIGSHVKFTSTSQIFSCLDNQFGEEALVISIELNKRESLTTYYVKNKSKKIDISRMIYKANGMELIFKKNLSQKDILKIAPKSLVELVNRKPREGINKPKLLVTRSRCFLVLELFFEKAGAKLGDLGPSNAYIKHIREIIHLPGLRGNPERNYPVSDIGEFYIGSFENYVASIIAEWQSNKDKFRLNQLVAYLSKLGLTTKVSVKAINETEVELQVGRLVNGADSTNKVMVSIADVGLGVSQALPVLVALLVARPGQLVYLEQPEIHLHPRAQSALAQVMADAARRGVRIVVETHSDLLLLGIQTLVAEGKLPPELVKFHWFQRDETGSTQITSSDLDEAGAFSEDWPEDFAQVRLKAESRYLDAAEAHLISR